MNDIDRFYTPDPAAFAASYLTHIQQTLQRIDPTEVGHFIQTIVDARDRGATIFFMGGTAAAPTASHFANDFAIGVNDYEKPVKALSLADNMALISAVGNDFGYEDIFSRSCRCSARRATLSWRFRPREIRRICSRRSRTGQDRRDHHGGVDVV